MNKILLIITGSIAASKCKEIITLLNINEVKIKLIQNFEKSFGAEIIYDI